MMIAFTSQKRRLGFTLIDLLVCIGIIGILLGMLLPAVNAARAAARKMICSTRLRDLGFATAQYEINNRRLPPNLTSIYWQWQFHLLPYIEQAHVYREFTSQSDLANQWLTFRAFLCPEDPNGEYPMRQYVSGSLVGKSDYTGVAGTTETAADGVFPPYGESIGGSRTKGLRLSDVVDGLSNTFLYGERPPANNGTVGSWLRGLTYLNATVGVKEQGPFEFGQGDEPMTECGPQRYQMGHADNPCSAGHNWSYHASGAHFVRVDGAVSFYPYSIDEQVLIAYATRNGGEIVVDSQ